jgi:hypothetical protein
VVGGREGQEYIQHHFSLKHIVKYFRSPVSAADIDRWRSREIVAPLFMGDDEEQQELICTHLTLPWRLSPLPQTRILRRTSSHAGETGK